MLLPHPIIHHPFSYKFGSFGFTGFGLAVLLCFLVGQVVAQKELVRRGHDPEPVNDMVFAAVIGGLLGAKLYYVVVLQHWAPILSSRLNYRWSAIRPKICCCAIHFTHNRTRK